MSDFKNILKRLQEKSVKKPMPTKTKVADEAAEQYTKLKEEGKIPKNKFGKTMTKTQYIDSIITAFLNKD